MDFFKKTMFSIAIWNAVSQKYMEIGKHEEHVSWYISTNITQFIIKAGLNN